MFKLFSAFRKDKVWDFNGGIHPPEMKTQSNGTPLRQVSLPQRFVIPLKQHIGAEGELCVKVGDRVLRGQPLTRGWGRMLPVHAPTSGTIAAIAPHTTAHPSALAEMSVIIDADGEDRWIERDGWSDYQTRTREALIERIHQFGVAGLGGAGFPTGSKLRGGGDKIKTLIINAAECEPYITADDRLMQDCAAQIVEGIRILAHILQPEEVLIGIEDNKPQAISMLRAVLCDAHGISLRVIPTKYPSGGAKQLTQILTGKQVPHGGRSSDIGVLMQNVGTAYAVKRAVIDGEPLTERVVTLTGEAVTRPGNVWARLGTPVRHLLNDAGFCPSAEPMVIMGGPLMGFTLPWLDVPVVKITNCLLAPSASEMGEPQEEKGCIRCSACADSLARPICCRSSCTGSAKVSSTIKPLPIIWRTASSAAPARGYVQVIFRWCSTSVRKRPRSRRFVRKSSALRKPKPDSRPDRRAWSVRKPRAPSGIKKPPFSLPPKIRRRLAPPWPGYGINSAMPRSRS